LDSSVLAHTFMAGIENTDCMLFCLEEVKWTDECVFNKI
jgi:hypothetical protein